MNRRIDKPGSVINGNEKVSIRLGDPVCLDLVYGAADVVDEGIYILVSNLSLW